MFSRTGFIALEEELSTLMSERRFLHSKGTAECCLALVRQYGETLDLDLCYTAALLHDIARDWNEADLLQYAEDHPLYLEAEEEGDPVLLHAPVGSHLLHMLGYESSLCLAVRYHTLGSRNMGRLGLVVFIADYIEPTREHLTDATREALRSLPSLEMICLEILGMHKEYLYTKGKKPARCSEELESFILSGGRL